MAHHRCTRCKEEVGIRHKFAQGLFCEDCLRELGLGPRRGVLSGVFGFFRDIWDFVTDIARSPFQLRQERKITVSRMKVQANVMKMKALNIPPNPTSGSPQKR